MRILPYVKMKKIPFITISLEMKAMLSKLIKIATLVNC